MNVGDDPFVMNEQSDSLKLHLRPFVKTHFESDSVRTIGGFYSDVRVEDTAIDQPIYNYFYNTRSASNQATGVMHRFGCKMELKVTDRFMKYAKTVIRKLKPLEHWELISEEEWLEQSSYSEARKQQLRDAREKCNTSNVSYCNSKSFIKKESFPKPNAPRIINSPDDKIKIILGSLQASIDKSMFRQWKHWFVKGTDPKDWVNRMQETFGNMGVINTDFSSFECHHRGRLAELVFYWQMHMLRNVHASRAQKRFRWKLIRGTNRNKMDKLVAEIDETLMSGVAWTSSANGLLNFLINSYLCLNHGNEDLSIDELVSNLDHFKGLFEGDDGIFEDRGQRAEAAKELGLKLKFDRYPTYAGASFCSMVVFPGEQDLCYDFKKALTNFTQLPDEYRNSSELKCMALLRAKALSYKYVYGNSPIVGVLADKVLELTRSIDARGSLAVLEGPKREYAEKALLRKDYLNPCRPTDTTREAYARKFKISPEEQIFIENEIKASGKRIRVSIAHHFKPEQLLMSIRHLTDHDECTSIPVTVPPRVASALRLGINGKSCIRVAKVDKQCRDNLYAILP